MLLWGPRTDWIFSQNCGFELKIQTQKNKKMKIKCQSFRDSCALSCLSESRTDVPAYTPPPPPSHRPECVPLISPADELKLQSLKIDGCGPSIVIKIVKMKYNRIDVKIWLVSTSFKIYIEILSKLYITYTIFNYNTISLRCSCFPVPVKGLYQTASYNLHVMHLVRI